MWNIHERPRKFVDHPWVFYIELYTFTPKSLPYFNLGNFAKAKPLGPQSKVQLLPLEWLGGVLEMVIVEQQR